MNPLVSILIHPIPENKFIIPRVSLPIFKFNFFLSIQQRYEIVKRCDKISSLASVETIIRNLHWIIFIGINSFKAFNKESISYL